MDKKFKKVIKRLKNRCNFWTEEEKHYLKEFKKAGIYPTTITRDAEIMTEYFPGRTAIAVESKYRSLDV